MKKSIIIMLMMAAITITGCVPQDAVIEDRYSGTEGLVFNFIRNMPPDDSVYENTVFKTGLELQNRGAETVHGHMSIGYENAMLEISSTDITDLDTGEKRSYTDLIEYTLNGKGSQGKGYQGQRLRGIVNLESKEIALSEEQQTELSFNFCYDTKTLLKESVCIDPDIYEEHPREKACAMQDLSLYGGQGAPVAITRIESLMIPDEEDSAKVRFKIYISNQQGGLIIDKESIKKACTGESVGRDNYNIIRINPALDGRDLVCARVDDEGRFDLSKTADNAIECETADSYPMSSSAHNEELEILLEYGYAESISKTITIYEKRKIV